jgi:hypothetical protein
MFTWICPKCGKEVPPAYSDCPNCAAAGEQAEPVEEAPQETTLRSGPRKAPAAARARRAGLPGWTWSLIFAAAFVGLGLGAFYAFRTAPPVQSTSQPGLKLETPPIQAAASVTNDPVFKNLEITGLRLVEDSKQEPYLQFVVVNHSAADLGDISATAKLQAVSSSKDQKPVATFSFKTSLGPYESKDLKVPVNTTLRVYELPDWQFLRAEIIGQ